MRVNEPVLPSSPGGDAGRRVPPILESERSSPRAERSSGSCCRCCCSLPIFGLLIPSFASYEDVWNALSSLETSALIALTLLTVLVESCKAGAFALIIEPLRFRDAFLAQESAAVVSNTVPGPSGTAARYVSYRKFGISNEDFATSYVVNSSVSNGLPLVLPSIGLVLLSTPKDVPGAGLDARPDRARRVGAAARHRGPGPAQRAVPPTASDYASVGASTG